eukprot:gnl/MRDRNA2_/MRDRNA2_203590_c0_seq1.p2 gnl/MRDRNA2_/MRDRNA2_203590_c0~~gnl/MRDRNA2_/MRDRNA2_203590_c0_seq1.p2  ORF type:complete len:122 (-),score=22.84 gnl/MRDRNA2_/MRDRNA2_203590_c0_seq1:56-421(-)
MMQQGLAVTNQVEAGFVLLARAEAMGLLANASDSYPLIRTLLEACRLDGDCDGTFQLQAAAERLGLISLVPMSEAYVQEAGDSYHPAMLTGQIQNQSTIEALMHIWYVHASHMNRIHLSAC